MLEKRSFFTPATRFTSKTIIEDFIFYKNKIFFKKKKNIIKKKKIFGSNCFVSLSNLKKYNFCGVLKEPIYNKKPFKSFFIVKSIFNNTFLIPAVDSSYCGSKFFDYSCNIFFTKCIYLNSLITLENLPFDLSVCCVTNNLNNKITFGKATGSIITKLKAKKTIKLILVKLPSSLNYFFIKIAKGFIGQKENFFNNRYIEGKWGFSLHKTKSIKVRGVAMNPVDHPNGGRGKTKQPEKSPWGWIAKHNK